MAPVSVQINLNNKNIKVNGDDISLSYQRGVVLIYFCLNKDEWHGRRTIIEKVWPDIHRIDRVVDQVVFAINTLFKKKYKIKAIISFAKKGYKLNPDIKVNTIGVIKSYLDEPPLLVEPGKYHLHNNKKTEVELLGIANYHQMNYCIFIDSKKVFHILPNSEFFSLYKKIL